MAWARSSVLAAAAAALISAQAAHAAPVQTAPMADPLVSLSVLGTAQSRAAVCATGVACAMPATFGAAATPATMTAASAAAAQDYSRDRRINPLWIGLGLLFFIAIVVAITSGGGDGDGNLSPVSPD